jgi:hypothetical protein
MLVAMMIVGDQFGATGLDGHDAFEIISLAIDKITSLQSLPGFHHFADTVDFRLGQAAR